MAFRGHLSAVSADIDLGLSVIKRPFKICNSQRNKRKGIVVKNLQELKGKASVAFKFKLASCRVFLENDGTEVEDDEYLSTLPEQTLLLITDGAEWTANNDVPLHHPSSSFPASLERNESLEIQDDVDSTHPLSDFLLKQIKQNPLYFMSFSDDQLHSVTMCDISYLARALTMTEHEAGFYQDTCQRELDKRDEMRQACELLKLYDRGMQEQSGEPESKKLKS